MNEPTDRRTGWLGRLAAVVAWLADGVLMAGVLVLLALQVGVIQQQIKGVVESSASGALTGSLRIDRLDGPLPFGVSLRGAQLRGPEGRVLASIESARADISLVSLMSGGLRVHSVRVDGVRAFAHRTADGTLNVTTLTTQSPEAPSEPSTTSQEAGFWLDIESIQLTDVRALWVDETVTELPARVETDKAARGDDAPAPPSVEGLHKWTSGGEKAPEVLGRIRGWRTEGRGAPAVAAIDEFELRGSFTMDGWGVLGARVERLGARVAADTVPGIDELGLDELRVRYDPGAHGARPDVRASIEALTAAPGFELRGLRARAPLPAGDEVDAESEIDSRPNSGYAVQIEELSATPAFAAATGLMETSPWNKRLSLSLTGAGTLDDAGLALSGSVGEAAIDAAARGGMQDGEGSVQAVVSWDKLRSKLTPLVEDGIESNGSVDLEWSGPTSLDDVASINDTTVEVSVVGGRQSYDVMSLDKVVARASWRDQRLDLPTFEVRGALGQVSARGTIRPWGGQSMFDLQGRLGSDKPGHPLTDYLGGRWSPGDGRFELHLRGRRRADAGPESRLLSTFERVSAQVSWDIASFQFPGITVKKTDGSLDAGLQRTSGTDRRVDIRSELDAGMQLFQLGGVETKRTSMNYSLAVDGWSTAGSTLRSLLGAREADVDLTARTASTTTDALSVSSGELEASVDRPARSDSWRTSLRAEAGWLQSAGASLESLRARSDIRLDTSGTTRSGNQTEWDWTAVTIERSELSVSADAVGAGGADLRGVRAEGQFRGRPTAPQGVLNTDIRRVASVAGTYRTVELNLESRRERRFSVDFGATPAADTQQGRGVNETKTNEPTSAANQSTASPEASPERTDSTDPRRVTLELETTVSGAWTEATLHRMRISRGDIQWSEEMNAALGWGGGDYRVEGFELASGRQRIGVDATYNSAGVIDAGLRIDRLKLRPLYTLTGLSTLETLRGRLSTEARVKGTIDSPSAAIDMRARDIEYAGYGPITVSLAFTGDDRLLDLDDFSLRNKEAVLLNAEMSVPVEGGTSGPGGYSLARDRPFEVALEVPAVSLDRLARLAAPEMQLPVSGTLNAELNASGRLDRPVVDASVSGQRLRYAPGAEEDEEAPAPIEEMQFSAGVGYNPAMRPSLKLSAGGSWHDQTLLDAVVQTDLPVHRWVEAPPSANAIARAFYDNQLEATVDVGPVDVDALPVEILESADASGRVMASTSVTGSPLAPEASLSIDVDDFGWNRYRDIYVDVQATLENELLSISKMFVEWDADPILRATAELPIPVRSVLLGRSVQDVPLQARLQLEPLPLTKLSPFDYTFAYLKGQFAAYLTVDGTLRDPEFAARVALTDTHLSRQDRATVAVQVTGRDDRVRMATAICRNDRTVLAGRASAPLNLDPIDVAVAGEPLLIDGPLEGQFNGTRVPLANVVPPALTQGLAEDLDGTFSVDMTLDGTWETPKPTGTLAVRDGAVTLPSYGRRFKDIQLRSSVDRDALEVSRVRVADDNGSIEGVAKVPLESFSPSSLTANIEAKEFDLTGFAAGYTAFVSGKIDAGGDFEEERYAFDLDVAGLEVDLPESQPRGSYPTTLDKDIVVASRRGETSQILDLETLSTGRDSGGSYEISVDVDLDRRSWVRHPNGDVNFTGALDVTMTPTILTLSGGADTLRGDFEFLGRDFSIPNKTDVIRFTGSYPPNPRLNIEAQHPLDQNIAEEIGQATGGEPQIVVRVTGSAYEPRLTMESDPAMTESEIIFVLMTGRPPSDAGVGEDQGVASQAVAAASGLFAGLLQQQLRGSFPVDMVRLETGSNGLENSRLRVGKYITTNLFVSSAYQFSGQGEDDSGGFTTRVEYHFLPSWMVEAKYGDDNTGEFNVFWDLY